MTSKAGRGSRDPLECAIETALVPGCFVGDRSCTSFIQELEGVERGIVPLIETSPDRAVSLYEAFLAGCYEKAEELDDSSGGFGEFVQELFCGWVSARQSRGASPEETAAQLLAWMDDDPYGFCTGLDTKVSSALDKAGLVALVSHVRDRLDASASTVGMMSDGNERNYESRRWGETLRALYIAQRDLLAYVQLAEETGPTPKDCRAVAGLLIVKRKPHEALSWVERGMEISAKDPRSSYSSYELRNLKRELLLKLGRRDEALESAWAEFAEHPNIYSYEELMKFVPRQHRSFWHAKAMDAAGRAELSSQFGLFVETKETERLKELVDQGTDDGLEAVSHYALEPAARHLEESHPGIAARLWKTMGMRIVNSGKSKHYRAALGNFERAMRCYEQAGLTAQWAEVVRDVRSKHHRKHGFMPGFEKLVSGTGPSNEPQFLERARARWSKVGPAANS